jgi:hypothetical protein
VPVHSASPNRWIAVAVVAAAVAASAAWYFARRGTERPEVSQMTPSATPAVVVSQASPVPRATETQNESRQEVEQSKSQEQQARENALQAELAETQRKLAQMQQAAHERPPETPPPASGPWLFPDSSSRYLSREELSSLNPGQLWRARNEIYARNGYRFTTARGIAYAQSLGAYYHGVDPNDDRVFSRMNPVERANVSLIRSMERH